MDTSLLSLKKLKKNRDSCKLYPLCGLFYNTDTMLCPFPARIGEVPLRAERESIRWRLVNEVSCMRCYNKVAI